MTTNKNFNKFTFYLHRLNVNMPKISVNESMR